MAVLVEANSVIVRVQAINDHHAGGWAAFDESVPNNTLCSDNDVARVGFMNPNDCEPFVAGLQGRGLVFLRDGRCQDIAIAIQGAGLSFPCDWLEYGPVEIEPTRFVAAVWRKGAANSPVACPVDWQYEKSLSRQSVIVPPEQMDRSLKFLRHQDGIDVHLNLQTGQEVYIGRPKQP
jgi:hypothetical protein